MCNDSLAHAQGHAGFILSVAIQIQQKLDSLVSDTHANNRRLEGCPSHGPQLTMAALSCRFVDLKMFGFAHNFYALARADKCIPSPNNIYLAIRAMDESMTSSA